MTGNVLTLLAILGKVPFVSRSQKGVVKMKFLKSFLGILISLSVMSFYLGELPFLGKVQDIAYAKGGGSRSSSSSRSSGGGWGSKSSSKSSSKASSSTAPKKSAGWSGSSRPDTKADTKVNASKDANLAARAKAQGTAFNSRTEAQKAFQNDPKVKQKYTSSYSTQPSSRPSHIPQTTKDTSGNTYNVTYNQDRGGYGYMDGMGTWMMYDALSDMAMMSMLMNDNNYHYPGVIQSASGTTGVVASQEKSHTALWIFLAVVATIGCVVMLAIFIERY